VPDIWDSAFNIIFAHGNYEMAACKLNWVRRWIMLIVSDVVCLDVCTQLFASQPIQWQMMHTKYSALRPVASSGMNMFLSIRKSSLTGLKLILQLYNMPKAVRPTRKTALHGIFRDHSSPTFLLSRVW
jgi:hypothetical protein